jgi:hypothetical protein
MKSSSYYSFSHDLEKAREDLSCPQRHLFQAMQHPEQLEPFLQLVRELKCKSFLELGCWSMGLSKKVIEECPDINEAMGVDINMVEFTPTSRLSFAQGDYDKDTKLRKMIKNNGPWDMVFIDGCHDLGCVERDVLFALDVGENVALHDIIYFPACKESWEVLSKMDRPCRAFTKTPSGIEPWERCGIGVFIRDVNFGF